MHVLDLSDIALFQNESASQATGVENYGKILDVFTSVRIRGWAW